jgi:ankyrin repeat protein
MVYMKASGLQDATALHAALSGFQASGEQKNETAKMAEQGHDYLGTVMLLLERQADVTAKTRAGETPLHIAAGKGATTAARALIANGADIEAMTPSGRTPLFSAISNGQRGAALYLLNCGADATTAPPCPTAPPRRRAAPPARQPDAPLRAGSCLRAGKAFCMWQH